ncbi:YqzH family protein [Bacillus thermotolerans]|uniref:Uncharacterized protein n=1 Tax=Bacillus thermotolerans TaxID=1221996 RepID=A0A0F5ICE2_BACTR|nr:YqzH family protein [Bacillus thermotolerans]KKB42842.1 hypothetical protein QY95_03315 [Bacillus thermotolerans]
MLDSLFIKRKIKQCLRQYEFHIEESELEVVYEELLLRIYKHQLAEDGELYEIIEDEVYEFLARG